MDELVGQVQRARRRLNLQGFLGRLPWCLGVGFSLAAIAIAVAKWYPVSSEPWVWNASWLGGAFVVSLIAAIVWSWAVRLDDLAAAVEVDQRFDLKERISSSLSLSLEQSESEAGQALIGDAEKRIRRVNVVDRFRVRPGRLSLLPLVPMALAMLIIFVIDEAKPSVASTQTNQIQTQQQFKKSTDVLRKRMKERQKRTSEKGLTEADKLLRELDRELDELQKKGVKNQQEALVKLNTLADKLKKRQQELGGKKALKEKLAKLKKFTDGPGEKLAQAMKMGDLNKALDQIENLQEKMQKQNLNQEEQQQLADQLNQMKKQLDDAVKKFNEKKQNLQEQIDQAKAGGDQAKAKQLQEQMDQMQQQAPDMEQLKQMAEKLGQCAKCAGEGDMQQARQALDDLAGNLQDMQQELDELETLEMAMDDIQQCKNGMCQGGEKPGNGQGQGEGKGAGQKKIAGLGQGGDGKQPGEGLGKGRGKGDRPISENDTDFFDTQVRQKIGPGKAVAAGSADGPNAKRRAREKIKSSYDNDSRGPADPLSGQRLPKGHRKFVEEYFDNVRDDSE